jgi:nitric-oxide synthase
MLQLVRGIRTPGLGRKYPTPVRGPAAGGGGTRLTLVARGSVVPAPREPAPATAPEADRVDPAAAEEFLAQYADEIRPSPALARRRRRDVLTEIERTGTYTHTSDELEFGARIAWRNAARCIGRLYWRSLRVRDRRHVREPAEVAAECVQHLREATRGGRVRSTLTVFAPRTPQAAGPLIHNDQLVRYAAHRVGTGHDGSAVVRGDKANLALTDRAVALGWRRPDPPGRFDLLPLLVSVDGGVPGLFELPSDAVLEVELAHPELDCFADLELRWHAVPAISSMPLVVGGICYPAAPFNGWYLGTEIGARNLVDADRYDLLPVVAERMGLDTGSPRTLWRDRAALEVMRAVQHSFDAAGVTLADHHTEAERFLVHIDKERAAGRDCPAEWSWIVPPFSGGLTPVFHRYYDEPVPGVRPAFVTRGCPGPGVDAQRTDGRHPQL